jgi:hypothetical protein
MGAALMPDLLPVAEAQVIRVPGGTAYIWYPAPTVFVSRVEGHITESMASAMLVAGQRIIASDGSMVVFCDWEAVTGYDREARVTFTRGGRQFGRHVESNHYLVRARILSVAIQLANIVLGNLKPYTRRPEFEATLRSAIESRVRRAS